MVSGLGLELVVGGVGVVAWLKLVGLNRAAWVCGGDFNGFKSMAIGCCRRGCGGLG